MTTLEPLVPLVGYWVGGYLPVGLFCFERINLCEWGGSCAHVWVWGTLLPGIPPRLITSCGKMWLGWIFTSTGHVRRKNRPHSHHSDVSYWEVWCRIGGIRCHYITAPQAMSCWWWRAQPRAMHLFYGPVRYGGHQFQGVPPSLLSATFLNHDFSIYVYYIYSVVSYTIHW